MENQIRFPELMLHGFAVAEWDLHLCLLSFIETLPMICHSIQLMEGKRVFHRIIQIGRVVLLIYSSLLARGSTVLLRALSSWVLNISKDGAHTTHLGNMLQCLMIMFSFYSQDIPPFEFMDAVSHFPTAS